MKGQSKKRITIKGLVSNQTAVLILKNVAVAFFGLLCSRAQFLNALCPLGVLLSAAVPSLYTLSSGIGAFFGYLLFPAVDGSFRYIAALFAVVSIRLILTNFRDFSNSPPFLSIITLLSLTICNLVTFIGGDENAIMLLAEGVLAGGLTYFISRAFKIDLKRGTGLSPEELACAVISVDILLLSLLPLGFGGFSVGRTLTVCVILVASRFGSISGGTTAGAAIGFAVALAENNPILACLYSVSGLMSGICSSGSRYMTALGFIAPAFITLGLFGAEDTLLTMVIEIMIASGIFICLPKDFCVILAMFFCPPARLESLEGMRKSLVMRLRLASGALSDVSGTIEEVATRLGKIDIPEPSDIFKRCEKDACKGCSFRISCWETETDDTMRALGLLSSQIRSGECSLESAAPVFYKKCLRPQKLENSLKKHYTDYLARLSAEDRIVAVRGVVSDQFEGISDMLLDLGEEFENSRHYDLDMAQTVVRSLREIGLLVSDCGCSVDKYGRMTIEAKLHNVENKAVSRKKILDQLEGTCERHFIPPTLRAIDDILYLTITEKPKYTPDVGVSQFPESSSGLCGDSYSYFGDGTGRFFMVLSDGMGTGGRAAVDGAMTTGLLERLLKAGFGFDCSLKILNSALLYKSTEESLATVDIACIDLHTGEVSLYKAGAAPSFVRRNGKIGKAESHSLPIGILRDVGFDRSNVLLRKDDIIVLLSDGATVSGTDWICGEIERFSDASASTLAEIIAEGALRRSDKAHRDDITVIVTILNSRL